MSIDPNRDTGRTSKQMKEAPIGATFVWCKDDTWYARKLAEFVGRKDLLIAPSNVFKGDSLRGICKPIVVDHAWKAKNEEEQARMHMFVTRCHG